VGINVPLTSTLYAAGLRAGRFVSPLSRATCDKRRRRWVARRIADRSGAAAWHQRRIALHVGLLSRSAREADPAAGRDVPWQVVAIRPQAIATRSDLLEHRTV
jgi:hypothetical protein